MIDFSGINTDYQERLRLIRIENEKAQEKRKSEIENKIPEIKNINSDISSSSLDLMKRQLTTQMSGSEKVDARKKLSDYISFLSSKKRSLLIQNGFPANYLDPLYSCHICNDTGNINGEICSCVKKMQVADLYKASGLEKQLSAENFDTFDISLFSNKPYNNMEPPCVLMTDTAKQFKNFCDTFDDTSPSLNFLLFGDVGLGKTFLCNCVAKALLDTGHSVLYLSSNELFENVLSPFLMNKKKYEDESRLLSTTYHYIFESNLLIIDDLGTEFLNEFIRAQLFEIVNRRVIKGLSTIISTNLDPAALKDRYTERVMSRFVQSYVFCHLYGDNIRYQKKKMLLNKKG